MPKAQGIRTQRVAGRRRGNPTWGKPMGWEIAPATLTEFEQQVQRLGLSPAQYEYSLPLKRWVRAHKNNRYVPEWLLQTWQMDVIHEFTNY